MLLLVYDQDHYFTITSSNSSFTECERNPTSHLYSSFFSPNSNCNNSPYEGCPFTGTYRTPTGSITFKKCNFTHMHTSADNGGAIYYTHTSGTLTVVSCVFIECVSNTAHDNGNGGGAIYAHTVSKVDISASLFLSCACYSLDGCDGGAVELYTLSSQPFINQCAFILCYADDEGGALSIWDSAADDSYACTECCFIGCSVPTANTGHVPCCGALVLAINHAVLCFSSLLFSSNRGWIGGAYGTDYNVDSAVPTLSFCFFCSNAAAHGGDVYFECELSDSPLLHCSSTSAAPRLSYLVIEGGWTNPNAYRNKDFWLPQGSISFTHFISG